MSPDTPLTAYLRQIVMAEPGTIRAAVAFEALEEDDTCCFFDDLMRHGCISGMVGSLIYYCDTHAFFDAHYAEIEAERVNDYETAGLVI